MQRYKIKGSKARRKAVCFGKKPGQPARQAQALTGLGERHSFIEKGKDLKIANKKDLNNRGLFLYLKNRLFTFLLRN